jgi:asparagine synthase (glutamine-hydrolysing)
LTALAGFWSFSENREPQASCAEMLSAQKAYGPDQKDQLAFGPISLGRNLCTLLPEDDWDEQPLVGGDGRFALVADVRLDNRGELRSKLGLDPSQTRKYADSDYLLKALERWGDETPNHLLGDYAFASFDRLQQRLLLARDPLGQRPLFWHRGADFIAFASMPKGLHAIKQVRRYPNSSAVARFLENGRLLPAEGFFSGMERVPPGHVVSITAEGARRRRHWNPERRTLRLGHFDEYVEAYRDELDRAVRSRLRSREPVIATHLSGGWDSGAVTATAARISTHQVVAFTATPSASGTRADPKNRFSEEWPLAAAVTALHPSIEHCRVESALSSPVDSLEQGVSCFERPLFNLCNHGWLAQIRETARARGARVLLSGEIGNWSITAGPIDALADYRRDHGLEAWWQVARGLKARREARWRGVFASTFRDSLPQSFWQFLAPLSSGAQVSSALRPDIRKTLDLSLDGHSADHFSRTVKAYEEMDFGEYRKGILGGWGVDKRDPTADVRLIEFCLSLPTEMLLNASARRPLAKAALSDRLPPEVLNATCKGYQSSEWYVGLTGDLKRVEALIASFASHPVASRVLDVERLKSMLRDWPED